MIRFRVGLWLIFLLQLPAWSQEFLIVSGKVTDASSGEVLPFAQVALKGSASGTVTNDEGLFRLTVRDARSDDSLAVSFLGFATESIPLASGDTGIREINLTPSAFILKEVEILALTPEEVLRRTFDRIPENFGTDSIILTAFIRTRKIVNNKLAEYTEAIVENLKDGYYTYKPGDVEKKHRTSNIPNLFKGRVISDTNRVNLLGDVGANARCLGCNFSPDVAEFPYETVLDERLWKHMTLKMREQRNPDGGKIYRISFDQNNKTARMLQQGEIVIDARDFSIIRLSYKPSYKAFDAYEKSKYGRSWFLNNEPGWIQEMPLGETTITYARRGDHVTLGTIRGEYRVTYTHPSRRQQIVYTYQNDVVVTDVTRNPEKIRHFCGNKMLGVGQRWDEVVGETDEAFWENFNYLPVEEKLRQELKEVGK